MIRPTKLALAELWASLHPVGIGLFLAIVLTAIFAGVISIPIGSATRLSGVIEWLALGGGGRGGYYETAYVNLPGRDVVARLPNANSCKVGSRISLLK
jgi:hypothetical protein